MINLPRSRFARTPLFTLAVAIAAGILIGRCFHIESRSSLIVELILIAFLSVLALVVVRSKAAPALLILITAFALSGAALVTVADRSAPNRLAQLLDRRVIQLGEPLELTGIIEGRPEPAPESLYFTLKAERVRAGQTESAVTGTVLLSARLSTGQLKTEFDSLDLRHGARIRVMTTLDREDEFRNPGVMPFTEYLERKGLDATGEIKSPLTFTASHLRRWCSSG